MSRDYFVSYNYATHYGDSGFGMTSYQFSEGLDTMADVMVMAEGIRDLIEDCKVVVILNWKEIDPADPEREARRSLAEPSQPHPKEGPHD